MITNCIYIVVVCKLLLCKHMFCFYFPNFPLKFTLPILFWAIYMDSFPAFETDQKANHSLCPHLTSLVYTAKQISFCWFSFFFFFTHSENIKIRREEKHSTGNQHLNSRLEHDLDKVRMLSCICWYHCCHSIAFSPSSSSRRKQSV